MKINYIDNDPDMGIDYDWSLIKKTIKKLKLYPKKDKDGGDVWNPLHVPLDRAKWFLFMSLRSKGKTTNFLLLGLVMNKLYGTVIQYVVQNEARVMPKFTKGLFRVVNEFGYISKITDGRWSSIVLKARRWYYCNYDDNGKISEMSKDYVCIMLSIDKQDTYKSIHNEPRGDLIIYDEFIGKYYIPNEFIDLCQLISTIKRLRKSPIMVLLSNTVDINSPYFNELEVSEEVYRMSAGDRQIVTSSGGSNVYVEIIDPKKSTKRVEADRMFFGFKNRQLGAITGSTLWAEKNYPHIIKSDNTKIILRRHYISYNNKLVNLELATTEMGLAVYAHWATKTYDDSIIYKIDDIRSPLHRYKCGYTRLDKRLWQLYSLNKFYYATNDVGSFVASYLQYCKNL